MIKMLLPVLAALLLSHAEAGAQGKISDGSVVGGAILPERNAVLELESNRRGLLLPRVPLSSTVLPAPLDTHIAGMSVYNTATAGDVTPGYYYNNGSKWARVSSGEYLVFAGDTALRDDIPLGVTIITSTGASVSDTVASRSFTLTRSAMVMISYTVLVGSIRDDTGGVILDGVPRQINNFLRFESVPPGSPVPAGNTAAFSSFPYTSSAGGGAIGYFTNSATLNVILSPGTYHLNLMGSLFGSSKSVRAVFAPAGENRFSIIAFPL